MALSPTIVTYPEGREDEETVITAVPALVEGHWTIITQKSPFHPVDPWWPDQPADRGALTLGGLSAEVVSVEAVGQNVGTGEFRLNRDRQIRRSDQDWIWHVGHIVRELDIEGAREGATVGLHVDSQYRQAIAAGHSACHLAALALNAVTHGFWSKEAKRDTQGHFDFDQEAIETSLIGEYGSVDRYRLGKSIRKAGFAAERLWAAMAELPAEVEKVANKLAGDIGAIRVEPHGTAFHERRAWRATYGATELVIPCGGVHLSDAKSLVPMTIRMDRLNDSEFEMTTSVVQVGDTNSRP